MDREEYLEAKRYRLELVLIGFAMATSGSREKILGEIADEDLSKTGTRVSLAALRSKDEEKFTDALSTLGVEVRGKEKPIKAVIRTLKRMKRERDIREHVGTIMGHMSIGNMADAELRLEEALEYVQNTTS